MTAMHRFLKAAKPAVGSPAKRAAYSSLLYMVLCSFYIFLSGRWAAASAASTEQLLAIEIAKGLGFVVVTGLLFFMVTFARWRKIKHQEETIIVQEQALLLSERKSVAGMCAATLAHDLNNLLMSLNGLLDGLKENQRDPGYVSAMQDGLEKSIANLSHLAKRVASTARQVIPDTVVETNIAEAVDRLVAIVRKHPDLRNCEVSITHAPSVPVVVNVALLEEAILNLLINAGQAAGPGGVVNVRLRDEQDCVVLEVHDSGPGVSPDDYESIFTPCYTTKPDGTGLGLLAVRAFANSCEGAVTVDRSDLGGALFVIRIPKPNG
ncbi:MAG TPA: HAMP domain-containing sensor histidine kinase [Kiritimatiellia bacterium]|nr:HAMP domain-containing sensor histidine kinase [Kiritimatiellia bacterium]HMO99233.1 HAMP domain-containing sensor histidine kinase [Kiritimatiellia bacterium]HMP97888.1 HAMP domain-containing sensor histidine kinase [Kiritimatiellia bacterium]